MENVNCRHSVLLIVIMTILIVVNILTNFQSIILLTDIDQNMLRLH